MTPVFEIVAARKSSEEKGHPQYVRVVVVSMQSLSFRQVLTMNRTDLYCRFAKETHKFNANAEILEFSSMGIEQSRYT